LMPTLRATSDTDGKKLQGNLRLLTKLAVVNAIESVTVCLSRCDK